jgi:hypothetical protein
VLKWQSTNSSLTFSLNGLPAPTFLKEGNKNTVYSSRLIFSWISISAISENSQNKLELLFIVDKTK